MSLKSQQGLETFPEGVRRIGIAHELLRRLVSHWPFLHGAWRIPIELGKFLGSRNPNGVVGGVGAGDVLFPFRAGDLQDQAYWFLYEKDVRRTLKRLLAPGSIFIDIGGSQGWHTGYALALVSPGGSVLACEPHPENAESLRSLKALNPGKDLRVHELAVSDFNGETTLLAAQDAGLHTIVPEFHQEVCTVPRTPIRVETTTLDDLLAQHPDLELHRGPPGW